MPHISTLMLIKAAVEKKPLRIPTNRFTDGSLLHSQETTTEETFLLLCEQSHADNRSQVLQVSSERLDSSPFVVAFKSATAPAFVFSSSRFVFVSVEDGCQMYHRKINHYRAEPSFHETKPPCKSFSKTFLYVFTCTPQCKRSALSVCFSVALKNNRRRFET